MKKMKIRLMLLLSVTALCFTACHKTPTIKDIAGTYNGYTLANCAYFQDRCTDGETLTVEANEDGTAKVTFKSDSYGEFEIANAQMTENDGAYLLSGDGQTQMGMGDNVSTYNCSFTATIRSFDDAEMQFSMPAVMGGLTIVFKTGKAPVSESSK